MSGSVQHSGYITAGVIEADALARVGIGSSNARRKIKKYADGCLNMGNTRVVGTATADNSRTPPNENKNR